MTSLCRDCGEPVGPERDYPAAWPFDSDCACGPPPRANGLEPIEETLRKVQEHVNELKAGASSANADPGVEGLAATPARPFIHPNPALAATQPVAKQEPTEEQQESRSLGRPVPEPELQG